MAIVRVKLGEYISSEEERKAIEKRLDAIKDEDIDYSDIPPLTDKDWQKAVTYAQFNKQTHNNEVA